MVSAQQKCISNDFKIFGNIQQPFVTVGKIYDVEFLTSGPFLCSFILIDDHSNKVMIDQINSHNFDDVDFYNESQKLNEFCVKIPNLKIGDKVLLSDIYDGKQDYYRISLLDDGWLSEVTYQLNDLMYVTYYFRGQRNNKYLIDFIRIHQKDF